MGNFSRALNQFKRFAGTGLAFVLLVGIGALPTLCADERNMSNSNGNTEELVDRDELTVDEETRTPEGRSHARSTIYHRVGDEFRSKNSSVPVSLVEQIRKIALASEAKSKPDLEDFGITKESIEKNRDIMLRSAYGGYGMRNIKPPAFEALPEEIRKLFEYETVEKNALAELSQSMNSAYNCVVFSLPGNPRIMLLSRHRQTGMLPWLIRSEGRNWLTYDRSLPPLLAKIASSKSQRALSDEKPDYRMQDFDNKDAQRAKTWADAFFARYETYSRDQVSSYGDIESAKKVVGWPLVSNKFKIEDAKAYNEGSLDIQVDVLIPGSVVDKVRWHSEKNSKDNSHSPDWSGFWHWYQSMENAAQSTKWLSKWRKDGEGRSILAMQTFDIPNDKTEDHMSWKDRERCKLWKTFGLVGRPKYYFRLLENGVYTRDVFIGSPYELSVVTNLGPHGGPTASLPKFFKGSTNSVLRMHEQEDERFTDRICALVNQEGVVTRQSPIPPNYALHSDLKPPSAGETEYDYSWPVDFNTDEDIVYLDRRFDGEGEVFGFNGFDKPVSVGLVTNTGKVLVTPSWKYIGPFSCGMAMVYDQAGKGGYITEKGEVLVKPQFDDAETFHEGLAEVRKGDKCGFIDTQGNIAIPLVYDSIRRFSEGVAAVKKGTKFGFIDKTGKFVIEPQFGRARHFINGLAYVQIDGQRAYIDHSGMPIGGKFYEVLNRFSNDRAMVYRDSKYGYIDQKGREIFPPGITNASDFRNGVAVVMVGEEKKAIDPEGKFVQAPVSHNDFWEGPIKEGLVIHRVNSKSYGFSDRLGKIVIKPEFESVGVFDGGICPVQKNGHWGIINKTGAFVITPQFEELDKYPSEGKIAFRTGSKWGVLDAKGQIILKPTFTKIYPYKNGMAVVQNGLKFGYIDASGKVIFSPQFDAAHQFSKQGIALVDMRIHQIEKERMP